MSYFVAEIGVNHGGSVDASFRLIDAAKQANADAVKFQAFNAKLLGRPEIAPLELPRAALLATRAYANSVGLDWLCTPFDVDALAWLAMLKPPYMKLASGAIFNKPLLKAASTCGSPILLSTGMSALHEVRDAMAVIGRPDVTLLHCTSAYPAPFEAANMLSILTLRRTFMCDVGYSDHTVNADAIVMAITLGARMIEMHLTLYRNAPGPDHKASYEPVQFADTVRRAKQAEIMLGDGIKITQACERPTREIWKHD